MEDTTTKITDTISDAVRNVVEITRERIFTPMYFYFLGAWIVTNWKFVYSLLFVNEETILQTYQVLKVDYLAQMYSLEWLLPLLNSILKLLIIPLISSFVIIWWLSKLSEMFFQKHEEHQMNKRVIKRDVEYREKVHYAKSKREIREQELDNKIKYVGNKGFNEWLDEQNEGVNIGRASMLPSDVLYNTDYKAYEAALDDYINQQRKIVEDIVVQQEIDRRRGEIIIKNMATSTQEVLSLFYKPEYLALLVAVFAVVISAVAVFINVRIFLKIGNTLLLKRNTLSCDK